MDSKQFGLKRKRNNNEDETNEIEPITFTQTSLLDSIFPVGYLHNLNAIERARLLKIMIFISANSNFDKGKFEINKSLQ